MAHPKKSIRVEKIVGSQVLKRCAELRQSFVDRIRVLFVGPDQNIKVFRRAGLRMEILLRSRQQSDI